MKSSSALNFLILFFVSALSGLAWAGGDRDDGDCDYGHHGYSGVPPQQSGGAGSPAYPPNQPYPYPYPVPTNGETTTVTVTVTETVTETNAGIPAPTGTTEPQPTGAAMPMKASFSTAAVIIAMVAAALQLA